ncbi:MAG: hypothetical protein H7173_12675 [Rhodoferax sp.]|nr:hypothetical protein [Pseudorhodobacter sp.]
MMDTTEKLERDAESHRANVESTLDRLKDRMSVDQMVGGVGRFLGLSDPAETLRNVSRQVKANPVALGLVGMGLAWFAIGGRREGKPPTQWSKQRWQGQKNETDWDARVAELTGDAGAKISSAASEVTDQASELVHSARTKVQDGLSAVSDRANDLRHGFTARLEDQPLLVGGLAVVLGTIVGAVLPRTETEDALMGDQRDQLLADAKQASSSLRDRAVGAAQHTFDAAVGSARDEGLLPDGDETVVSRLSAVANATIDEAKRQVEPVLHGDTAEDTRTP